MNKLKLFSNEVNKKNNSIKKKQFSHKNKGNHKGISYYLFSIFIIGLLIVVYININREIFETDSNEKENKGIIYDVRSDNDFKKYSKIRGSGSVDDPFLLENIQFYTRESKIIIENTQAHLQIKNCIFNSNSKTYIDISNTSNISISNNVFRKSILERNFNYGIYDGGSKNLSITNNLFENIYEGISLHWTNNFIISNNTIKNSERAIFLRIYSKDETNKNFISENIIFNCSSLRIADESSMDPYLYPANIFINDNNFNNVSFYFCRHEEIHIYNNNFNEIGYFGFSKVKKTEFYNNIFKCTNNITINNNSLEEIPLFDNGSIGNYWNDYIGADENGDGIGDTPYLVAPSIYDHYPLMQPEFM